MKLKTLEGVLEVPNYWIKINISLQKRRSGRVPKVIQFRLWFRYHDNYKCLHSFHRQRHCVSKLLSFVMSHPQYIELSLMSLRVVRETTFHFL